MVRKNKKHNGLNRARERERKGALKNAATFFTLVNPILWVLMRVESDGRVKKTAPTNAVKFREIEADAHRHTHAQHFQTSSKRVE